MSYRLIECTFEEHAEQMLAIFNDAIVNSTALYDYSPRTMDNMVSWFEVKRANDFPVIGLVDSSGSLAAFASYGFFRTFPAYKYTVEHSIYVHEKHRGAGLGKQLLDELIGVARSQGKHVLIAAIDADNAASIAIHVRGGFSLVGTLPEVGFKFGRWLNLVFYQMVLDTPADPIDG